MSRFFRIATISLCFVLFSSSAKAAEKGNSVSEDSLSKFLNMSSSTLKSILKARPLDPSIAFDSEILKTMKTLNEINHMDVDVYWANIVGCSAHPKLGITLNQKELQKFKKEEGDKNFIDIIRLILSHEQAHMFQFKYYNLKDMADVHNTRSIEAQADILAGVSLISCMLKEKVLDKDISDKKIKDWANFIMKIGTDEWTQTFHPRPEQRGRLITLGMNAELQTSDLAMYKMTKDPTIWKRIKDAQERFKQRKTAEREAMGKVGFTEFKTGPGYDCELPIINEKNLEQENLVDWSNRLSKEIVHYGDPIGEKQ